MCTARSKCLLGLLAAIAVTNAGADRIYVNANQASGAHNGTSWTNAYHDLQEALENAAEGDQIWVAKSTPAQPAYFPSVRYPDDPNDPNDPRRATFLIPAGVKVYGGFRGYDAYTDPNHPYLGEPNLPLRDPGRYLTILDGDLNQDDQIENFPFGSSFDDNSYHVVFFNSTHAITGALTKLSGFVIRNGRADGDAEGSNAYGIADDMGGGVIVFVHPDNASPLLERLVLDHNYANAAGAGILVAGKSPTYLANCRFESNWVGDPNDPSLPDGYGAGMAVSKDHEGTSFTLQNSIFISNRVVRGTGAGIYVPRFASRFPAYPSVANCTFYGNQVDKDPNDPTNEDTLAGAVFCAWDDQSPASPTFHISNCIVWNNSTPQLGERVEACFCDVEDASYWSVNRDL